MRNCQMCHAILIFRHIINVLTECSPAQFVEANAGKLSATYLVSGISSDAGTRRRLQLVNKDKLDELKETGRFSEVSFYVYFLLSLFELRTYLSLPAFSW